MWEYVLDQIKTNSFFQGGFVLSILAAIGIWIKSFLPWIWGRIKRQFSYSIRIENSTELYYIFNEWLKTNHSNKYKNVLLFGKRSSIEDPNHLEFVETNYNSSFVFWHKGFPIFLSSVREKFESGLSGNGYLNYYICTVPFKKRILKSLMDFCVSEDSKIRMKNKKNYVYSCDEYGNWNKGFETKTKPFDKIFNKEKLILSDDIDRFLLDKEIYLHRGTPYRRGYLLYGKPGNGKTTTIIALSQKYKRDVYSISLNGMKNEDALNRAFQNINPNSFVLFEDIDGNLNGREKIKNEISFSSLLNVLDGIYSKEGLLTFFTTNCPDKLDDALKRCGRIDLHVEFENLDRVNTENMLELFFNEKINFKNYKNKYSACELQEICISSKNVSEALEKLKIT